MCITCGCTNFKLSFLTVSFICIFVSFLSPHLTEAQRLEEKLNSILYSIRAIPTDSFLLRKERELTKGVPALSNFNEAFAPFVTSGCFFHLTTFLTPFDFHEVPTFPVVLRRLTSCNLVAHVLLAHLRIRINKIYANQVWIRSNSHIPTETNSSLAKCFNSSYIDAGIITRDHVELCVKLLYLNFSMKSIPWKCEVHVGMFPPESTVREKFFASTMQYPGVWNYNLYQGLRDRPTFPSSMSRFNILFINAGLHDTFVGENLYAIWARNHIPEDFRSYPETRMTLLDVSTDLFLIFLTERYADKALKQRTEVISTLWNLRICLECSFHSNLSFEYLQEIHWEMWTTTGPGSLTTDTVNQGALWKIYRRFSPFEKEQDFYFFFEQCNNKNEYPFHHDLSTNNFTGKSIVHMWQTITSNYTYRRVRSQPACSSDTIELVELQFYNPFSAIVLEINVDVLIDSSEDIPLSILNSLFAMRFVSCGRPPKSPFAFKELLNVFHWRVWLWFFVSTGASLIFKITMDGEKGGQHVSSVLKDCLEYLRVFLEQGSEILQSNTTTKWRIFIGLFALGHVVLSNAYRNTNVYNMVQPRVPVPYERFSQLINDSFRIFTRNVEQMDFELFATGKPFNLSEILITDHSLTFTYYPKWAWLISEVSKLSKALNRGGDTSEKDQAKVYRLRNYSRLHPDLLNIVNETSVEFQNQIKTFPADPFDVEPPDIKWSMKINDREQITLEEELAKCNKVALILPDVLARSVTQKIKHKENLYLGTENLLDSFITFKLKGYVPKQVFSRMRAVLSAGVWQKWKGLAESKANRVIERNSGHPSKLQKPTMTGNLLILFIVLLAGLGISTVALLTEYIFCILQRFIVLCVAYLVLKQSNFKHLSDIKRRIRYW